MRALVYHGLGRKAVHEAPDPEITDDGDIIVRVDATTICGTDLHIVMGDVPVAPGRILGHEAVGTVDKVERLPVIDADGHLVGIISRADVLAVFDRADEDIRKEIIDEVLLGEFLVDPKAFDLKVSSGIVTLTGMPETNEVGHEIVARVRHVQGVVAVRDRLSYLSS
jgi:CBS domain-containing protein